jgi:transposase InsO family protein
VGVRLARGELLAFVDSDDVWMPEYLSCQVEFLNSHPNVYASIADALLFGSCPETTWRMLKKGTSPILGFEQVLKRVGGQLPSAMVARRWRVLQVGMFDEAMRIGEDIEFFVRLCCPDGKIGYLGQVLVKYRQRPGSITDDPRHRKWNRAESRALRRLAKKLNLTPAHSRLLTNEISECIAGLALSDAYRHIYNGDFSRASRCIRIANTHYRKSRLALFVVCLNLFPRLAVLLLYWHSKFFNKRVHEQIPLAPLQN